MSRTARGRRGLSLLEILIASAIFVVLIVPSIALVLSANRLSFSANRLLDVTLYGQMLLEALQLCPPDAYLAVPDGAELVIFETAGAPPPPGPPVAFAPPVPPVPPPPIGEQVTALLGHEPPFPYSVKRLVRVIGLPGDHVGVLLELTFDRLPDDPATAHTLVLRGTLTRRLP